MLKITTYLIWILTGSAAIVTLDGCFSSKDQAHILYASDTVDIRGVTYYYSETDVPQFTLDYYDEINLKKEVFLLNEEPITREYFYRGDRYRLRTNYFNQRREVKINVKVISG